MKRLKNSLIIILVVFSFHFSFAQTPDSLKLSNIKHIELVGEIVEDSMALITKSDIDIINNVFDQRNKLDTLNKINDTIIHNMESIILNKDSLLYHKDLVILNQKEIEYRLQSLLNDADNTISLQENELKKERRKKNFWKSTTGIAVIGIIILLI